MENSQFIYKYKPKDLSDINYFSMTNSILKVKTIIFHMNKYLSSEKQMFS